MRLGNSQTRLKSLLCHEVLVDKDSKKRVGLIYNYQIKNNVCILGLSRYLFGIMEMVLTVVDIEFRGLSYKCGIYVQSIEIDIHIRNKYF